MSLSNWLLFCGVALLVTFTPGPGVLLAVSNSVTVGPRRTVFSSLGAAVGLFALSGAAMVGMGTVLAVSSTAFTVLKVVGALYLVCLGIKQWRSSEPARAPVTNAHASASAPWRLFAQGLGVALTNPKAILFFSALFPQFLTPGESIFIQSLLLTTTFVVCAMLSHVFYVLVAQVLKDRFADLARACPCTRISGGAFVILGLGLLRVQSKAA
jgi:homoserine/homoserine lactone efflux protein